MARDTDRWHSIGELLGQMRSPQSQESTPDSRALSSATIRQEANCAICGGTGWVEAEGRSHECHCRRLRRALLTVPPLYRKSRLSDCQEFVNEIRAWFLRPTANLFINGLPGRGKTYLAAAIAIGTAYKGIPTIFRSSFAFYGDLRNAMGNSEFSNEREIIQSYCEIDLLILDDIGSGGLTDFERRSLLEVIERRLEDMRPTIITSNWTIQEIAERIDERLASRLASFVSLTIEGVDRRIS